MGEMKKMKKGLVLEYQNVIGEAVPTDRISILKKSGISKTESILLIAYINSQISPRISARFDYSIESQQKIFDYIFRIEPNNILKNNLRKKITSENLIFNRTSNLWAYTDIINSDLHTGEKDDPVSSDMLMAFFQYYLCVNNATNVLNKDIDENEPRVEVLNASLLASNEYYEHIDPINTFYRGNKLLTFLENHDEYGDAFKKYIFELTGKTVKEYLILLMSIYFSDHSSTEFSFYYRLDVEEKAFEVFSVRETPVSGNQMEALHLRKSPIYKLNDRDFVILDDKFLLEKSYNLIIWDFLFEKLLAGVIDANRGKIVKKYRSQIGYFFEDYIKELIEYSLPFLKHPKPKLFDDLKVGGIEIGDIFIRQNKKILIGEVKSSNINSRSKYGESLSELYDHDRSKFFKTHGLDQLVTNLTRLCDQPSLYDVKLDFSKRHEIYPVIITNERTLTVGFTIEIFNREFNTRFNRANYPCLDIKPLLIIHISDLEFLQEYLKLKRINLFNFISDHQKKYAYQLKLSMALGALSPLHRKDIGTHIFGEQNS